MGNAIYYDNINIIYIYIYITGAEIVVKKKGGGSLFTGIRLYTAFLTCKPGLLR